MSLEEQRCEDSRSRGGRDWQHRRRSAVKAGEDVTLIGRKLHAEAIRRDGLVLEVESGKTVVRVKAAEHLDFRPQLALLTVKSQDIISAVKQAQSFLSGVPIVTMQNGVQSDDMVAGILGKEHVISSVVVFSGSFLEPGKVSYSIPFSSTAPLIGEPFGAYGNRLRTLLALFNRALPTEASEKTVSPQGQWQEDEYDNGVPGQHLRQTAVRPRSPDAT